MHGHGNDWTEERVELLKKLYAEGLSAGAIAAELGGITRNAVIGKVHRLGLSGRADATERKRQGGRVQAAKLASRRVITARTVKSRRQERAVATRVADAPTELPPIGQRQSIATVREGQCKFPFGDPREADFSLCGGRALLGLSWCGYHARVVFQPRIP